MKFILFLLTSLVALSQNFNYRGTVLNRATGEPISYALVSIVGLGKSTFSGDKGDFSIDSKYRTLRLKVEKIGFETQYRDVVSSDEELIFELNISDFNSAEVTVYAEDLPTRIMRAVIEDKIKQRQTLENYTYEFYSKIVISSDTLTAGRTDYQTDTTINSILESYSKSYFKSPNKRYSRVIKKRQSVNVPPDDNFVSFDNSLNVYDEKVKIFNEQIQTPFNEDALDWYNFTLENVYRDSTGKRIHKILAMPKDDTRKLFKGYLHIDSLEFMPVRAELFPNNRVQMPFNASLFYTQEFQKINGYVLPSKLDVHGSADAQVLWAFNPRVDIKVETKQVNYQLNLEDIDDVFDGNRSDVGQDAKDAEDSFWNSDNVLKLKPKEEAAYEQIRKAIQSPDSVRGTNFIAKTIQPITNRLRFLNLPPFTGLEDKIRYNRVSGFTPGLGMFGYPLKQTKINFYSGYGLADQRFWGDIKIEQFLNKNRNYSVFGNFYQRLQRMDNPYVLTQGKITPIALIFNRDYADYFYNDGFELGLAYGFGQFRQVDRFVFVRPWQFRISYKNEFHSPGVKNTEFSFLGFGLDFRDNPTANIGRNNAIQAELFLNYARQRRLGNIGMYLRAEHTEPSFQSDFDYSLLYSEIAFKSRTFYPLWKLDLRLAGGITRGDVPVQKYFSIETSTAGLTAPGAMRTLLPKEYYGDRFISANLEHNFGEIFPGLIRIPSVSSFGLELILIGNIAWSNFSDSSLQQNQNLDYMFNFTQENEEQIFSEVGFGLNRLFLFFRFDFTYRITKGLGPKFMITFKGADFF